MESLLPFLQGTCTPYNMPVYPGAQRIIAESRNNAPSGQFIDNETLQAKWVTGMPVDPVASDSSHATCRSSMMLVRRLLNLAWMQFLLKR